MGNKRFRDIFTEALERRRYRIQSRDFAHGNSTHNPHDLEGMVDTPENQGFIRHVGTSGAYSTAALYLSLAAAALGLNCTKSPSPTAPTGGKGTQVYSCQSIDGTSLGQATFENVTLRAPMTTNLDGLKSKGCTTNGFDPQFFVSRSPPVGEQLGLFDANTSNGQLRVTPDGTPKVIYLFPSGIDYGCLLATGFGQSLPSGRYTTVRLLKGGESFPLEGVTVIDSPEREHLVPNGLKILNNGATEVKPDAILRYGGLAWDKNNAGAVLAGGLATYFGSGYAGYHIGNKFVIFTNVTQNDVYATATSAAEALEAYVRRDNMCGQPSTDGLFAKGNLSELSQEGKIRLRFIMVFPQ